jgi:hypothetical protein
MMPYLFRLSCTSGLVEALAAAWLSSFFREARAVRSERCQGRALIMPAPLPVTRQEAIAKICRAIEDVRLSRAATQHAIG